MRLFQRIPDSSVLNGSPRDEQMCRAAQPIAPRGSVVRKNLSSTRTKIEMLAVMRIQACRDE